MTWWQWLLIALAPSVAVGLVFLAFVVRHPDGTSRGPNYV